MEKFFSKSVREIFSMEVMNSNHIGRPEADNPAVDISDQLSNDKLVVMSKWNPKFPKAPYYGNIDPLKDPELVRFFRQMREMDHRAYYQTNRQERDIITNSKVIGLIAYHLEAEAIYEAGFGDWGDPVMKSLTKAGLELFNQNPDLVQHRLN